MITIIIHDGIIFFRTQKRRREMKKKGMKENNWKIKINQRKWVKFLLISFLFVSFYVFSGEETQKRRTKNQKNVGNKTKTKQREREKKKIVTIIIRRRRGGGEREENWLVGYFNLQGQLRTYNNWLRDIFPPERWRPLFDFAFPKQRFCVKFNDKFIHR